MDVGVVLEEWEDSNLGEVEANADEISDFSRDDKERRGEVQVR